MTEMFRQKTKSDLSTKNNNTIILLHNVGNTKLGLPNIVHAQFVNYDVCVFPYVAQESYSCKEIEFGIE